MQIEEAISIQQKDATEDTRVTHLDGITMGDTSLRGVSRCNPKLWILFTRLERRQYTSAITSPSPFRILKKAVQKRMHLLIISFCTYLMKQVSVTNAYSPMINYPKI